jgi:hypothetical protein
MAAEVDRDAGELLLEAMPAEESNESWQVWESTREWFEAERTDLKARLRHFNTDKYAPPTDEELKKYPARYFVIHHLVDNRIIMSDAELREIRPAVRVVEERQETPAPAQPIPQAAPAIDLDAIADRVAAKLKPELAQSAPTPAQPIDPFLDFITKMKAMREFEASLRPAQTEDTATVLRRIVREELEERAPERESETDTETQVLMTALKDTGLRERLANGLSKWIDPDSAPAKHWAVELGAMAFDNSEKLPAIAGAVVSVAGGLFSLFKGTPKPAPPVPQQAAQPTPTTQPQAAGGPGTFAEEADAVISHVLESCQKNSSVRRSARSLLWLFDSFPAETANVQALFSMPGATACQVLAQNLTNPEATKILNMPHAPAWFDMLSDAIAKRRNVKEVAPADESEEAAQVKTA